MGGKERDMCLQTAPPRGGTQEVLGFRPGMGPAQKNHTNKETLKCYDLETLSCFLSRGCIGSFGDEVRELT